MSLNARLGVILEEIRQVMTNCERGEFARVVDDIVGARRVFPAGAGMTGMVMRMLGMRLTQAGRDVQIPGDATTTACVRGDLLLLASASGEKGTLIALAEIARAAGTKVALITASPQSRLAKLADTKLILPVPHDPARPGGLAGTQLLGSLFEGCLYFTTTLLIEEVLRHTGQGPENLLARHANLE